MNIAIDVGSGMTNVVRGKLEVALPSEVGVFETNNWVTDELRAGLVEFDGKKYSVGADAVAMIAPEHRFDTLSKDWCMTDGYLALMYASIAKVVPKGYKGKLNLCTGLPIATISEYSTELLKRLVGKHQFKIGPDSYHIEINDTKNRLKIIPQALGLYFFELSQKINREGKVAYFDFGTFTYGIGFIDNNKFSAYRSKGGEIGGAQLSRRLGELVLEHKHFKLDQDAAKRALAESKITLNGRCHDLSELIELAASNLMNDVLVELKDKWGGALDVTPVVGGGHGEHFYGIVKEHFLSAVKVNSDDRGMFDVVRGYQAYHQSLLAIKKKTNKAA